MGFSKSCFEQYKREIRILWWVLALGTLAAAGFHIFSVPLMIRYATSLTVLPDLTVEPEAPPVDLIFIDEAVVPEPEVTSSPPAEEEAVADEPAAAAAQPTPPPLASETAIPQTSSTVSADTVPTDVAIAAETAAEGGEGAVGSTDTIGLVSGSGSTEGEPTAPVTPPNVSTRQPVEEIARASRPSFRTVTCDPCSPPEYPLSEQRDRHEGQPVINVIFDQDGNVVEAVLETSSGNAELDQAALAEARENWRFRDPHRLGGQVSVEVTFVIEGSEQHEAAQAAGRRVSVDLPEQQAITPVAPAAAPEAPPPAPEAPDVEPPASEPPAPEAPNVEPPVPEASDPSPTDPATGEADAAVPDDPELPPIDPLLLELPELIPDSSSEIPAMPSVPSSILDPSPPPDAAPEADMEAAND
ncbi:MAG: energy transducer TonB [Synechococcales bacterium]|nr:energy transducer TonB [Synechococcales bacterium]